MPPRLPAAFDELVEYLPDPELVYLVGGAVRDALLGREVQDFDLAVPAGGVSLARHLADALGGSFVLLDESRGCARVVWTRAEERLVVDVADFRAPSLEGDLRARDLTINALAIPAVDAARLIDPLGGLADLQDGRIRLTSAAALQDDPLRALRVARFAVQMGFAVDPATTSSVRRYALRAGQVSAERLREELMKGFDEGAPRMFQHLAELGLLDACLPELATRSAAALELVQATWDLVTAVETGRIAELVAPLGPLAEGLRTRLALPLGAASSRRALLALTAAFCALGEAEEAARGAERRLAALRCSRTEQQFAGLVLRWQQKLSDLASTTPLSRRQLHRFHRGAGDWGTEAALLALARQGVDGELSTAPLADRTPEVIAAALWDDVIHPLPLFDGDELMQLFELAPGPLVGQLMAALAEEQAAGEVLSRDEAASFIHRLLAGRTNL